MSACLGPRRLFVGCRCNDPFHFAPSLLSKLRPCNSARKSAFSAVRSKDFSGSPGSFTDSVELKIAKTQYTLPLPGGNQGQPVLIYVTILGGSKCILCSKAVLAVRRIIASLSPQLCCQANPIREHPASSSPPHVPAASSSSSIGLVQVGTFPRGSGLGHSDNEHCGGAAIDREPGSGAIVSSGAGRGGTNAGSSQICEKCLEGGRELKDSRQNAAQQPTNAVVAVQVREINLNRPADWQQLGLPEAEVSAFLSEIPIVFVGREQACRLKFDGPAVRAALLRELDRLRRGGGSQ